ncbi:hypothetical protein SDC9_79716 [bioreactor metagenome]|uniref:Methyltransferase type 11 domain-containing protein n=1 Tax=bioreactor metagenome TaxID=1076179 RepID=A0A644YXP8_9ZZZZ|nr:class I SAM-dependent methyltransferase [Oscillibacter sp.]
MAYGNFLSRLNPCEPEAIFQLLPPLAANTSLLDLGCGRGTTLFWLAAHTSWSLSGADPDLSSCPADSTRVTLVQSAAERLPFENATFDVVLMECVFSLCEPRQCLRQIRRVLRPGGLALLSDLYARRGDDVEIRGSSLLHRIDREETLVRRFSGTGFRLLKQRDFSGELAALAGQMLLDGISCTCFAESDLAVLRACRAGYGVWLFERL